MRKLTTKEIQTISLDIMKDINKICQENNIRYYLAGGTLLGAIRHGGFIPWDDDIDIIMPRPDYEKFEEIYNKTTDSKYQLFSLHNNKYHWQPYSRVCDVETTLVYTSSSINEHNLYGVFIDICPMDGLPDEIEKSNKLFRKQKKRRSKYFALFRKLKYGKINPIKNTFIFIYNLAILVIGKIALRRILLKNIDRQAQKYKFNSSEFVGVNCTDGYGTGERIEKDEFIEQIDVEFEGEFFKTTKVYDKHLTNLYGNYMKLPPKNKRTIKHKFSVYRKEGNMNIALIIAAGKGERMNQDIPKQFLHIENKPLIIYTLQAFEKHPSIDAIAVVCLDGWHDILKAYAKQFGITKLKWVVSGGETGQQSIYNGLDVLKETCTEEDIVLIHDAIRPLISSDIISDCIAKTMIHESAITVIPCAEAMLLSSDTVSSSECIDRNTLKRTQTPQGFKYGKIMGAHEKAHDMGITNSVASCTLMIETGGTIHFSTGSEKNIKISTVEDIEIFKALLSVKKDDYLK